MKKNFAIVLLLLFASLSNADDKARRLIQPKSTTSDLTLTKLEDKGDLFAKFQGQTWVSGTFVVRWPAGASAIAYKTPDYLLVPDTASSSKLPYFVISDSTYINSYKVKTIEILNGEEALRLAFTDEAVRRILGRKTNSVRVTGRFEIGSFVVGVECDSPWARAELLKAELPDQLAVVHRKVQDGC